MVPCISWHANPAALGEADNRARATAADRALLALASGSSCSIVVAHSSVQGTPSGGRLPPYKVPREVIVASALPRNALGKVQKSELKVKA